MSGGSPLERAKRAWAGEYDGLSPAEANQRVRGFGVIVRGIASDGRVPVARFARSMGMELREAKDLFEKLVARGMQTDENGDIVGAALTTLQTPHSMRFGCRERYAWCALDALFIPGLLEETAEIESTCLVSGATVRLALSPEGIEAAEPSSTWLSVFLPGEGPRRLGPDSPT